MYYKRKIEETIIKYLDVKEIIALVGPRQAGKTTLLKHLVSQLDNAVFLSFEDVEVLDLFENNIKKFAQTYAPYHYVFIDEFQYSRQGGKKLKYLYDLFDFKLIISGSSAIDLTVRAIKHLVGRIFVFNLFQLDFEEFLQFQDPTALEELKKIKQGLAWSQLDRLDGHTLAGHKKINDLWSEFTVWGAYPRVALAKSDEEKKIVLKNIFNTYFLRDVRDALGLIDDFRLNKLIKLLAWQDGQMVEYASLAKSGEYDYMTLKKYLNFFDKTFICRLIKPYYKNKKSEIVKNPKIYFFDSGLRNYALDNFSPLASRDDKGMLLENYIFSQLIKAEQSVNYWRNKNKEEVDFITGDPNRPLAIECKSANQGLISKSLYAFINSYQPSEVLIFNDSNCLTVKTKGETIVRFFPYWLF